MFLILYFVFMGPDWYGPMFVNRDFSMAIDFVIFEKAQIQKIG